MYLSRFDLVTIDLVLRIMFQARGVIDDEILQNTENAIVGILVEYPKADVFLVQPDELEE